MRKTAAAIFVLLSSASSMAESTGEQKAWVLYPPASGADLQDYCETRLRYAEEELAKLLTDYDYTFTITATGKSKELIGTSCSIEAERSFTIKSTGQEN